MPVYTLAPGFVADASGAARAPIAKLDFLASKALSADGQVASVWTAHTGGSWKVVNIATGGDETYYVAKGAKKLAGGTVFREPQIDAWYVQRGSRVLPLDADAERAVGARHHRGRLPRARAQGVRGQAPRLPVRQEGRGRRLRPALRGRAPVPRRGPPTARGTPSSTAPPRPRETRAC